MADSTIGLPNDGPGKKLDTEQLTVGAETVQRERDRLAGAGAAELADVKTEALASHYGLVVRPINLTSPARSTLSSAELAIGASVDLDAATIPAATTGKLFVVDLASSAACKWDIKSRDGAVELTFTTVFTSEASPSARWQSPDKRFTTLLGNGVDENFRVTVTNLGNAAADVYATVYWDEV